MWKYVENQLKHKVFALNINGAAGQGENKQQQYKLAGNKENKY